VLTVEGAQRLTEDTETESFTVSVEIHRPYALGTLGDGFGRLWGQYMSKTRDGPSHVGDSGNMPSTLFAGSSQRFNLVAGL
jgi:hypothetical protein